MPNVTVLAMMGHFRPQRSANSPAAIDEIIKPNSAAPNTGPNVRTGI